MLQFTYAGWTVWYKPWTAAPTPIGLGQTAEGILALVCSPDEDGEDPIFMLLEIEYCFDCDTLQQCGGEHCFLCGGELAWAAASHWDLDA